MSTATAQELMRVLVYPKFRLTAQDQQELLADYLPSAEVVPDPSRSLAATRTTCPSCTSRRLAAPRRW